MNQAQFRRVYATVLFLQLFGAFGHFFAFAIQENFYGQENFLLPIYNALGIFQISVTSYFMPLSYIGIGMLLVLYLSHVLNLADRHSTLVILYLTPLAGAIVYTVYEIHQANNPIYQDNFFLDVVVAWFACLTHLIGLTVANWLERDPQI